jgi:hypothetical protein
MNLQLPLALAVSSTGFFFLFKFLLLMVHTVLNEEAAENRFISWPSNLR